MNDRPDSTLDPSVRDAAVTAIKAKAHALFAERQAIRDEMAALDQKLRRNEIAIFDCRGAARLFGDDIELPEDLATARSVWVRRVMNEPLRAPPPGHVAPASAAAPAAPMVRHYRPPAAFAGGSEVQPTLLGGLLGDGAPSVREIALQQLKRAGEQGTKASAIREVVESILKKRVHDKTVGMTLYRLSQEDPPKVRRDGQTWFFVPPPGGNEEPRR